MIAVIVTNLTKAEMYERIVRNGFSAQYEAEYIISRYCDPGDQIKWEVVER